MTDQTKVSPVSSILLFIGTLFSAISLFAASWLTAGRGDDGLAVGPNRMSMCYDGHCESRLLIREFKNAKLAIGLGSLTTLMLLVVIIFALITAIAQLKPGKSGLSLVGMILAAITFVVGMAFTFKMKEEGVSLGWTFFVFFLAMGLVIGGSVMGMMRPAAPMMMGGYPQGYPMGMQQQGWPQQQQPMMQQQPMPTPAQPMQQPAQWQQPQQAPQAPQQAQGAAPCTTCGTPATYVAQYQRYFCQRCNKYL